jgi:hypothetical protein
MELKFKQINKSKMNMKTIKLLFGLLAVASLVLVTSCNDDDEPDALSVVSVTGAGTDFDTGEPVSGIDLFGATSATDVPLDVVVTITFNKEVNAETVSNSTITVSGGDLEGYTVAVNGAEVTATPSSELQRGTDFTVTVDGSIVAADGGTLSGSASTTFRTAGIAPVNPPQAESQVVYWDFNGDANDRVSDNNPSAEIAVEYQEDRYGQAASAAYFDGDASIIEYPNSAGLIDAQDFTISFWVRTDTVGHVNADGNRTGMFVFGLGAFFGIQYEIFGSFEGSKFAISYENAEGTTFAEDMFFPSEATDNTNGGWQGWTFARSLTPEQMRGYLINEWYHVVYSYNSAEKVGALYFDGQLMKTFDFDLWPDGDTKQTAAGLQYRGTEPEVFDTFALGFIRSRQGTLFQDADFGNYDSPTANHFKGWLDDFRIFHATFSEQEVQELYNAEAPN